MATKKTAKKTTGGSYKSFMSAQMKKGVSMKDAAKAWRTKHGTAGKKVAKKK